jgi:hypothetical protein
MISIYRQLRRYFVTATVLSVLVIFVLSNIGMTVFFNNYVQKANLKSDQKIVLYLQDILQTEEGMAWRNFSGLMQFVWGEEAEILLYDNSGTLLFDSGLWGCAEGWGTARDVYETRQQRPSADALVYKTIPLKYKEKSWARSKSGGRKPSWPQPRDRSFVYTMNAVYLWRCCFPSYLSYYEQVLDGKFLQPLLIVKNNIRL